MPSWGSFTSEDLAGKTPKRDALEGAEHRGRQQ